MKIFFKFYFHAVKDYTAIPTKKIKEGGKLEYKYFAISDDLLEKHYLNHFIQNLS